LWVDFFGKEVLSRGN